MEGHPAESPIRGRRADSCRNHERIIRAATVLLAERPEATMDELTTAAGLGRTTVYRHFHAREQLVAEVYATAFSGTRRLIAEAAPEACPREELLERVVAALMRAVETYPVLANGPGPAPATGGSDTTGYEACLEALARVMRRAQDSGLLDASLPPRWLAGSLMDDCAGAVVFSAELRGCAPSPAALVRAAFERAWAAVPRDGKAW
ncbi:TetR/AcrR family transcriptional regulator [Actinorugispora endophytica]|nr:TetR/AcrR family transcriptional regulator [Actinorugispora endophytica]